MSIQRPHYWFLHWAQCLLVMGLSVSAANACLAYSPQDPVVQKLVRNGIKALEASVNSKTHYERKNPYDGGWGEHALAGYAHFKVEHDATNKVVKQGIKAAQFIARGLTVNDPGGHYSKSVYNVSLAAMLLAEVDKDQYKKELEQIASFFERRQMRGGGFSYSDEPLGDVSQVQYAMLALWTLDRAGIEFDYRMLPRTANWLRRVQDVEGGWPYMGIDNRGRIKQERVRTSLTLAGASGLLIAGDVLRIWGEGMSDDSAISGLPKAVKLFSGNADVVRPQIPTEPIFQSIKECEDYLLSNPTNPGVAEAVYPYYQIYTLERFHSFRAVAYAMDEDPSPVWYNDVVKYLIDNEESKGGWQKGGLLGVSTSTSLAILFLIRSTKKAIQESSVGTMAGGWQLPKDTTQISVDGTQIKGAPIAGAVTDLLSLLEEDGGSDVEVKSIPDDLKLATDPKERRAQLDRLERLVRGSNSWQARRVAARLLGQSDEMRVVPALIFALSDNDTKVRLYARDGLRFISRKFDGFGMPEKPTPKEWIAAERAWKAWYLKMNPVYVFLTD